MMYDNDEIQGERQNDPDICHTASGRTTVDHDEDDEHDDEDEGGTEHARLMKPLIVTTPLEPRDVGELSPSSKALKSRKKSFWGLHSRKLLRNLFAGTGSSFGGLVVVGGKGEDEGEETAVGDRVGRNSLQSSRGMSQKEEEEDWSPPANSGTSSTTSTVSAISASNVVATSTTANTTKSTTITATTGRVRLALFGHRPVGWLPAPTAAVVLGTSTPSSPASAETTPTASGAFAVAIVVAAVAAPFLPTSALANSSPADENEAEQECSLAESDEGCQPLLRPPPSTASDSLVVVSVPTEATLKLSCPSGSAGDGADVAAAAAAAATSATGVGGAKRPDGIFTSALRAAAGRWLTPSVSPSPSNTPVLTPSLTPLGTPSCGASPSASERLPLRGSHQGFHKNSTEMDARNEEKIRDGEDCNSQVWRGVGRSALPIFIGSGMSGSVAKGPRLPRPMLELRAGGVCEGETTYRPAPFGALSGAYSSALSGDFVGAGLASPASPGGSVSPAGPYSPRPERSVVSYRRAAENGLSIYRGGGDGGCEI